MKRPIEIVLFLFTFLLSVLFLPGRAAAQSEQTPSMVEAQYNGIPYLSGGVGEGEREALEQMERNYNLKLVFAVTEGNYLALVDVVIKDFSGNELLKATAKGPWFYARLEPGRYLVEAVTLRGHSKQRQVEVGGRLREEVFAWNRILAGEAR